MPRYQYRTKSHKGEHIMLTADWAIPEREGDGPVFRVTIYVSGYDKAYYVNLPEAESAKLGQILAEGPY